MRSLLYAAVFLALGGQALAQTNDPLDQWQRYAPLPDNFLGSVAFANGQFWGFAGGSVWRSQDGMNWTCSGFVPMEVPLGITYGNGTYVVVGEDGYDPELDGSVGLIATSSDGITWTAQDGPPGYSVMGGPAGYWLPTDLSYGYTGGLAFGNGLFVAALALMDTESHNS